jgi:hypothetical protein
VPALSNRPSSTSVASKYHKLLSVIVMEMRKFSDREAGPRRDGSRS